MLVSGERGRWRKDQMSEQYLITSTLASQAGHSTQESVLQHILTPPAPPRASNLKHEKSNSRKKYIIL
jgi:hypothetical protein